MRFVSFIYLTAAIELNRMNEFEIIMTKSNNNNINTN